MAEISSNTEVFVYTEGVVVPEDVARVRVHPSITIIPENTFYKRQKLKEVELCEGLLEIGSHAFFDCEELTEIRIPSTVTIIHEKAFFDCFSLQQVEFCEGLREIRSAAFCCYHLRRICLPNSVEHIGDEVFMSCRVFQFRTPPLITTISSGMICHTESTYSIELPESIAQIEETALEYCECLRNVAIPPNAWIQYDAFNCCTDLYQLFETQAQLINALKHRFDKLPIHKMIYYQSYNNVTLDQLTNALDMRSGQRRSARTKLDQTGNKPDCLGMTPLHILACSTVQNIDLYKVLVHKYPENLVAEDRWGAVPLLYAIWGGAPVEIVRYLVESYKSLYPDYELNWEEMMLTLGRADVDYDVIIKLSRMQEESFPNQVMDWSVILKKAVTLWDDDQPGYINKTAFKHLVRRSFAARVKAIGLKHFWGEMSDKMHETNVGSSAQGRRDYIAKIHEELALCIDEYNRLKEATALLELALWKKKMEDHWQEANEKRRIKRVKIEEIDLRSNVVLEVELILLLGMYCDIL